MISMRKALFALVVLAAVCQPAAAQTQPWANKLFGSDLSHDFGTVPRGAQLKYSFKMTNIYKVPLEIGEIRVGCHCLTAKESQKVLQPNETGYIHINMDGTRFTCHKNLKIQVK